MKEIGAVTIGNLIKAHYEKDEHKFKSYAEFIAEAYKEKGEERAERIIRSKIDGSYKNKPLAVILDKEIKEEPAIPQNKKAFVRRLEHRKSIRGTINEN